MDIYHLECTYFRIPRLNNRGRGGSTCRGRVGSRPARRRTPWDCWGCTRTPALVWTCTMHIMRRNSVPHCVYPSHQLNLGFYIEVDQPAKFFCLLIYCSLSFSTRWLWDTLYINLNEWQTRKRECKATWKFWIRWGNIWALRHRDPLPCWSTGRRGELTYFTSSGYIIFVDTWLLFSQKNISTHNR